MSSDTDRDLFATPECVRFQEILESEISESRVPDHDERAFAHRHLETCADCAALAGAVTLLEKGAKARRTPGEDASERVVRLHFGRKRVHRSAALIGMAAAAVVLIALLAGLGPWRAGNGGTLRLDLASGAPLVGGKVLAPGATAGQGEELSVPRGMAVLRAQGLLAVAADKGARLGIETLDRGNVSLRLFAGRVSIHLRPGLGTHLSVGTPSGRVVVKGTVFVVEIAGVDTRVDVVEGVVEVESPAWRPPRSEPVRAGWSLLVRQRRQAPLDPASGRATLTDLGLSSRELPDAPSSAPAADPVRTSDTGAEPSRTDSEAAQPDANAAGAHRTRTSKPTATPEPAPASPSADDLIRSARSCRTGRDWTCAADAYRRVTESYPQLPEAVTVLLPLAQIELDHLGNAEAALRHFRLYRERHPGGPLAQEALYGECRALDRLGRRAEERRALTELLTVYPSSMYSAQARAMLDSLP
ncbi:MAG: FecR domain-containing protein [Deltaproteobacteria bacterium]|nr:FecR domain-containing protein [Deltaproteobacteria bacterium]